MLKVKSWSIFVKLTRKRLEILKLGPEYQDRLDFEIKEIEKQGANRYWVNTFNDRKQFIDNKNGLVLPFLLGLTPIDPVKHKRIFICSETGIEDDIVEVVINGNSIDIPAKAFVLTKRGKIRAKDLQIGDEFI